LQHAHDALLQNGEASAISRQMGDMGFNDFQISSALQYRCVPDSAGRSRRC
jgi:hypothetical protein